MIRKFLVICLLGILFSIPQFIHAQANLDSIISMHLKVTGFENYIAEIKDFSIDGRLMQNNQAFPISIKAIMPGKYRIDMVFNQQKFSKISNGTTLWEYNPMIDSLKTGTCDKDEAQIFFERIVGSLYWYKKPGTMAKLMATTTIDDIEVYKIEFKHAGQSQVYYIDKYTYLIVRIDDDFVENKMTYYSDYRKTGKYFIPNSLTGYEHGLPIMGMKFNSVRINAGVNDSEFSKPVLSKN
jgi:outer membrane lipoprotein-sorting protein